MGTIGIDGLATGIDTTSLINQLMQVEAIPQSLLKAKASTAQSFITALQGLNTRIVSLGTAAKTAADPASWQAFKATSSSAGATASASASAQAGSVSFTVDAVASAQVSLTSAVPQPSTLFATQPPTVTIKKSDGTLVELHAASSDMADITKAINDSAAAGVKATAVRVSSAVPPDYRLQFTGAATGAAGSFEVYAGTAAEVGLGTATRIDGNLAHAATDATVTLWKGSAQEQSFSQSSNVFSGLMTGVDVTVAKVTAVGEDPVTISVTRDDAALKKLASSLVGSMTVVFAEIASQTKVTSTTTNGVTSVTGGTLTGDSAVRAVNQQLMTAMSYPVDDKSPATIGILLAKDGTFSLDETKFAAAMAADPAGVQSMVTQIAARVSAAATLMSDPYEGSVSLKITGQQSLVKSYGTQVEDWDRRLALRKEGLQKTYASLEVAMSNLNAQSSWLTSQLANLPTYA